MKRGDVVLAVIPYLEGGGGSKRRPVVVVQADSFNATLPDTIVAAVTSNLALAGPSNRLAIDPADPEGVSSGLAHRSVVRCDRLFAMPRREVGRTLGRLSPTHLAVLYDCLKAALALS